MDFFFFKVAFFSFQTNAVREHLIDLYQHADIFSGNDLRFP